MKKVFLPIVAVIVGILAASSAGAQAKEPLEAGKARRFGIGGDVSAINFTLGPMVKYWITDNIGTQVTYSAVGGFTGFNVRGIYEFTKAVNLGGEKLNPYLGIGYTSVSKKDDYGESSLTYKGSGASISGGLEGNLKQWHPNLFYTTEFIYSPFDLEAKYEATSLYGYGSESETVKTDFSNFGVGMSIVYYF